MGRSARADFRSGTGAIPAAGHAVASVDGETTGGGANPERHRDVPLGTGRMVVAAFLLAVLAGAWAVLESLILFPLQSDNNDEAVYLLQADALRRGNLFPPVPEDAAEAFVPWLGAVSGDRVVLKYTPVQAALIAGGRLVTGSDRAALAIAASAAVLGCIALAREVLASRRAALVAGAFLLLSPIFLIASGTFLPYLFALALLQGFGAALLAGFRRRSTGLVALAGLLLGIAIFARPYDAVLFAAPFGLWWLHAHRGSLSTLVRRTVPLVLGVALPVAAMLAYFYEATGDALTPVFRYLEPDDTIGFGERRMLPDGKHVTYGPVQALTGLGRLSLLTALWGFGGFALLGFAVIGLVRRRSPLLAWLALVAVTVPLGYVFFWGSWGSTEWGGPWRFGPLYYLPVFTPLAILGAAGFLRLWLRDRPLATASLAGMVAVSLVMVAVAQSSHRSYAEGRQLLYEGPRAAEALDEPAVVFLPPLQGPWLLQPFALARNATLDQKIIWALDRGDAANFDVLDEFPDRAPLRVTPHELPLEDQQPHLLNLGTRLEPMEATAGRSVTIDLQLRNPTRLPHVFLDVTAEGMRRSYLLDSTSRRGATYNQRLRVTRDAAELPGARLAEPVLPEATRRGNVMLSLYAVRTPGDPRALVAERDLAMRRRDGSVQVLLPGKLRRGSAGHRAIEIGGVEATSLRDAAAKRAVHDTATRRGPPVPASTAS